MFLFLEIQCNQTQELIRYSIVDDYRLKSENLGGAWCPKNQITKEAREWLEIDLHTIHLITATATQGRFGNGVGVEFAEYYLLEYWRPRLGKWVRYRDIKGEEVSALT